MLTFMLICNVLDSAYFTRMENIKVRLDLTANMLMFLNNVYVSKHTSPNNQAPAKTFRWDLLISLLWLCLCIDHLMSLNCCCFRLQTILFFISWASNFVGSKFIKSKAFWPVHPRSQILTFLNKIRMHYVLSYDFFPRPFSWF